MESDRILEYLEDHDAHYEIRFVADDEVIASVSSTDLDEAIAQSRKLDNAGILWATEELDYAQYESEVGVEL